VYYFILFYLEPDTFNHVGRGLDMNRRKFFTELASGIVIASSPQIFLPRLIKPIWKRSVDIDELTRLMIRWIRSEYCKSWMDEFGLYNEKLERGWKERKQMIAGML
jgi:hypothetical protein